MRRQLSPAARLAALGLFGLASFVSCTELAPIAVDVCGNSVIDYELGEECDGSVAAEVRDACTAEGLGPGCGARCAEPGEPGACHYVTSGDASCPVGWVQGSDEICRRPSGVFADEPFARVNGTALDGIIADFDADGVSDLFLAGLDEPPSVSYFDVSGSIAQTIALPASNVTAGFISADRADDTAADLIVANGPAITTFRGSEGRQLLQKAYAPFKSPVEDARLFSLPVVPVSAVTDQVPAGFDRALARVRLGTAVRYQEVEAATLELVSGADLTFLDLGGNAISDPVFANLLDDGPGQEPLPPFAEPALEIVEASTAQIYIGRFPANGAPVQTLPPPADETFVALLPVQGGDATRVAAITLTLDGTYFLHLVSPEVRHPQVPPNPTPPEPPELEIGYELPTGQPDEKLLAVGFLNDDSLPDIVTTHGVRFLVPNPQGIAQFTPAYVSNFEPFVDATITDINHDDRREIVTISAAGDIVLLLPATGYTFNPVPIAIPDRSRNLVTGDFDGDGFEDLLVISGDGDKCNTEDELYLLFGSASGMPEAPQLIGSLPGIERVIPIRFYFPFLPDGISDITIQTSCASNGDDGDFVGVFFGNASRIVSSPFSPYSAEFTLNPVIERITTGTLLSPDGGEPDGHDDLAFVASLQNQADETYYDRELRLVTVTGDAEMAASESRLRLVDGAAANITDSFMLLDHMPAIATGQLFDASPSDEVVVLSAYTTNAGPANVRLWVAEVQNGALESAYSAEIDAPDVEDFSFSRVRLFDYDDDGDLDVVAFIRRQRKDTSGVESTLFINDGSTLAPASLDASELGFVFDFAELTPPGCLGLTDCDDSARFIAAGSTELVHCPASTVTGCSLVDSQLARTVIVGDLDSDGLEDLGFVDVNGFQVFRQLSQAEAQQSIAED